MIRLAHPEYIYLLGILPALIVAYWLVSRARRKALQRFGEEHIVEEFQDGYPAMPPTPGNDRLLTMYDEASRALGYGPVTALDASRRGAGDLSFVAPFTSGMEGLGALGSGAHTPDERVDLSALTMQTERAALLLERLAGRPASDFAPARTGP